MIDLASALYDIKRIKEVWPDAPTAHLDMFKNLKFDFDLMEGKVTTYTSARDVSGTPIY